MLFPSLHLALVLPLCPAQPPAAADSPPPRVLENSAGITIRFPGVAAVHFAKDRGRVPGIRGIELNGRPAFTLRPDDLVSAPVLEIADACRWLELTNWRDYLGARATNAGGWVSRGGCRTRTVDLARATYLRTQIEGNTVTLLLRIRDGLVGWEWVGRTDSIRGMTYRGLGWRLVTQDMPGVVWAYWREPLPLGSDRWLLAQRWGGYVEERLTPTTRFSVAPTVMNAFWQPFSFVAGASGAQLGWFERPTAARMAIERDGPYLVRSLAIPFGPGPLRATPLRVLEYSTTPLGDPWARRNAWTAAYDELARLYGAQTGVRPTDPEPSYVWATAPESDYEGQVYGTPPTRPWLARFAGDLPKLAAIGIRAIHLQSPWHSDADHAVDERVDATRHGEPHHPPEYIGSGHAPWDWEVGPTIGGSKELARFTRRAHDLGLRVMLWTNPAHLSISSPELEAHVDWPMWSVDGTPHDEDYGDITGMSLRSGFRDEMLERLAIAQSATGVDGVFLDSFLTFGVALDYARPEPRPQLDAMLDLMQALQGRGLRDVLLEGVSVVGLSSGGFGYEATAYLGRPHPEELARFRAIQNREYGLYHYLADTFLEPESYYRALASKGVMAIFDLRQWKGLSSPQRNDIIRANREFSFVRPWMQHRHLIGNGSTWQGVAYRRDGAREVVVFSFVPFDMGLPGSWNVEDLTAARTFAAKDRWRTRPWHTYLARPR